MWTTFEVVGLFDGHGKVKADSTSFVYLKGNMMEISLNDDKKIDTMKAVWNPVTPDLGAAVAAVAPKPDKPPPAPKIIITEEEGIHFINELRTSMTKCFDTNDFTCFDYLLADELEWEMSGAVHGKGSKSDYAKMMAGGWGALNSMVHAVQRGYVVDSVAGTAATIFDMMVVVDAHGKVKDTEGAMWFGTIVQEMTFNKDKKITAFKGYWDSADPSLLKVAGAAMAALKA